MTIPFKNIPANIRTPLFYAEVDNSQANTGQINQRTLIIGQLTSAGSAVAAVPFISSGQSDVEAACGIDSLVALLHKAYRNADNFGEVWVLPLQDDPSAVAATATFAFNSAASANGTLAFYLNNTVYALPVVTTQTTNDLANALAALINADQSCPVNATASTNTVTFTAVNKGPCGNENQITVNYLGTAGGQVTPPGLTFTQTAFVNGATAPSLTAPLANLGDQPFDFIVSPYADTISLNAVKALLDDQTGRWSYSRRIYGHNFTVARGTLGALQTLGAGRNNQHESILGIYGSPTPAWMWAAAMTGAAAVSLRADPATPLHTLVIPGVLAPSLANRFSFSGRNTLLFTGISTFTVASDGTVALEMLITTYQKNAFGNADNSYLKIETMFNIAYILRRLETIVTSKYARVKLAANGTRFAAGSNIVTPNMIRSDLIATYRQLENDGYVQNADAFKAGLIVQQNSQNPNRVDVLWDGILIDQLDIFALLFQFRNQ